MIESLKTDVEPKFINEKVAKKLLKNKKLGKQFSARIISDTLGMEYKYVYNNITLSTDEIAFSALTIGSVADAVYYSDMMYINIEINSYNSESKKRQLESYVYQLYLGQLHSYKDYYKIKKVIQISIDLYDYLGHNEFIYNVFLMDKKHHEIVSDKLQIIHLNLAYLKNMSYNTIIKKKNKLMQDLYFLICGNSQLDNILEKSDSLMKEIINEAKQIASINQMDLYLTEEEMIKNDQEHFREIGRQEGLYERLSQIIISMYEHGYTIEQTAEVCKITKEEVEKVLKDNQNNKSK